ncbi:MAG: aspartate/glutamate racemase family protein, partial [Desulfobacterota bacterium]|nr:aspartate/glutamate racemase family protein [Thermodesulfobacteriota bacterium]
MLAENPALTRVGVLASRAVILNELYPRSFRQHGVQILYPAPEIEERLMEAIKKVKAGRYGPQEQGTLRRAAKELVAQGAEALIVACTELSLLTEALDPALPLVDTAQVLAEEIVRLAKDRT